MCAIHSYVVLWCLYILLYYSSLYVYVVLTVEFASGQFSGSESSEFIEVVVRITGGTFTTPITVTVTPSIQSPVSAMGKW